jgi:hypothetical protein
MSRFNSPTDIELAGEAALALGLAGKRLRKSLDALRAFDANQKRAAVDPLQRSRLIADAAELFWGYVVQRELLGLNDPDYIRKEYDVPAEVVNAMGPKRRARTK